MITTQKSARIGVYICHCGTNIAGALDVEQLTAFADKLPQVVLAKNYKYMCSDPGQDLVKKDIAEHGLDRVVVVACSPLLHEATFRKAAEDAGLNPFLVQMANIREQVAWVTRDKVDALEKAKAHVAAAARRVAQHEPLERKSVPITPRVLIVGGGIAGIEAALTLADADKEVILVEREPSIGGHMSMFDKTFPTLDCAACILTPKMTAVKSNPHIKLLTHSEVEKVDGAVGSYKVRVRRKARYISEENCVGCMACIDECVFPKPKFPNEYDQGLGLRKPVYLPFPQAVPPVPIIDPETCLQLSKGQCKQKCVEACGERQAVLLEQQDSIEEFEVGAIIVATGFKPFNPSVMPYYGYGTLPNVYTSLEIERLINAAGPTGGKLMLRDGSTPKRVVIVHCVGSRDKNYHTYCSKVCCMYSLKLAHLVKEKTEAEIFNCYIDIRTPGKGFEEFYNRVQNEGVHFIRGKVGDVSPVVSDNGQPTNMMTIQVDDTLLGKVRKIDADMVILAVGLEPQKDAEEVRRMFGISCSTEGFFLEKHPKLAPVNTANDGVFLAGVCQGVKDIPETVAQASAAAAKALALIDRGSIELEPNTAIIDEEHCSGCRVCNNLCPFEAIEYDEEKGVSRVIAELCKGCGTCVAACPAQAITGVHFTNNQIIAEIEGVLYDSAPPRKEAVSV
ncbi:MAG: CoB--CoM heterodisulfide reductase iron-sulfur subunit A family protein [Pirellulales bacterium]|nr:CoB--CoM heterodisulfide reductase iron-sulfur subunit A family protein [Pirellulales bacterium]